MWSRCIANFKQVKPSLLAAGNAQKKCLYSTSRVNSALKRTHYCGSLSEENLGQTVTLSGWIQTNRLNKFLVLRDIRGTVQILLDDACFQNKAENLKQMNKESVISVRGTVIKRPEGQENPKQSTGSIEVKCDTLVVLNECKSTLPFEITDMNKPNETVRLQYRYLDLRFREMQQNLVFRSTFVHKIREFMAANDFHDIETPTLFKRTPGGAREFIVPTNKPDAFYSLVQSPQQFKQLLMIAGMDKYYQIARCYRDEMTKPDRQPEFTQVDIEMSFVDKNDVMNCIESLLKHAWPFAEKKLSLPFRRMTYDECMHGYGTDKPDLRFDLKFVDLKEILGRHAPSGMSKLDSLLRTKAFSAYALKIPAEYNGLVELKTIEQEYKSIFDGTHFGDSSEFLVTLKKRKHRISQESETNLHKKYDVFS